MRVRRLCLVVTLCCATASVVAQTVSDSVRVVRRTLLLDVGRSRVQDTYLSPHGYAGPSVGALFVTERQARWGGGRVSVMGVYGADGGFLQREVGGGYRAWDASLTAAGGWHHNWHPTRGLRLAAGGLMELSVGGTYLSRGGNNPAAGRAAVQCVASGIAEWDFRLGRVPLQARAQLDIPLLGGMFSPEYGQSYYEIFSLGHYSHNVCFTHPLNAPSARLLTTLTVPVGRARLVVGYRGEARQSHIHDLKHHNWTHRFVIGYVRTLQWLR